MHLSLCIVFFAQYYMHCILCTLFYSLYSLHIIICIVFFAQYSMHCIAYIVFDAFYTSRFGTIFNTLTNLEVLFVGLHNMNCIETELPKFKILENWIRIVVCTKYLNWPALYLIHSIHLVLAPSLIPSPISKFYLLAYIIWIVLKFNCQI